MPRRVPGGGHLMRFRRWHRPEPYGDTSRKRAAFLRKQRSSYLTDRYSERKESGEAFMRRVNLTAAT